MTAARKCCEAAMRVLADAAMSARSAGRDVEADAITRARDELFRALSRALSDPPEEQDE